MTPGSYIVGVDLGQVNDYTAVTILKQVPGENPDTGKSESTYHVPHIDRFNDMPYPEQVRRIVAIIDRLRALPTSEGGGVKPRVVVDQTGVGRPVVDMLRQAGLDYLTPVTIHGGDQTTHEGGSWKVPKRELVSVLQVVLQSRRLLVVPALSLASTLASEMLAFKATISTTGHDSYGNDWRLNAHDDLVLATALAVWAAERPKARVLGFGSASYVNFPINNRVRFRNRR